MRKTLGFAAIIVLLMAVVLSTGCGRREVPNVVGMRQADAVRALQEEGYKLGNVSSVLTTAVALGRIAAQEPAAGERAKEGTAVNLAISFSDGKRVLVPTVTEMSRTTAEGVANTLGLEPMFVEEYSDEAPTDEVFNQSPAPGGEVDSGSILVMVVSKGAAPEKAKVPDVEGKSQADAESALKDAGFVPTVYSAYNSEVGKGKVIVQVPDEGSSQKVGSEVEIVVSLGKGTGAAKVPSVTGKKEADAVASIESAGLKAKKIYEYDADVAKGSVVVQFPDSGTTAAKGSEVIIVISKGKEPVDTVAVPNVVGMAPADAESALAQEGFSVTVQKTSGAADTDPVVYQFPAASTKVAPGSDVLVVIGVMP